MTDYLQILLTAIATGIGTGAGIAVGTYFVNKTLIQNFEKILEISKQKNGKTLTTSEG